MSRSKKTLLLLFSILIIGFIFNILSKNDLEENILEKQTTWTQEIGFVNWGHANSSLTSKKFNELIKRSSESEEPFSFTYYQNMKMNLLFTKIVLEHSTTYQIPPHLTRIELEQVFLEILLHVSNRFETMQGSFPISLIPGASQSSFRNGDMNGNLVSFYASINKTTSKEIKASFNEASTKEALLHLDDSNNWTENLTHRHSNIPSKIKQLLYPKKKIKLHSLSDKTNFYLK